MSTVRVQLFGPQAAMIQRREIPVELPGSSISAAALLQRLGEIEPRLAPSLAQSRLAVNQQFAAPTHTIHPSDEVALIGLVGGG